MTELEALRAMLEFVEIEAQHPEFCLSEGEYYGFKWVVSHNGRGYRQGYVRIPRGHPWYFLCHGDIEADVHGSLTWSYLSLVGHWWIGFDAQHGFDLADPDLPVPAFCHDMNEGLNRIWGSRLTGRMAAIRTQEYMEDECRSLCVQAAEAAGREGS